MCAWCKRIAKRLVPTVRDSRKEKTVYRMKSNFFIPDYLL
jgi:hypothetical protein